jgi:hypothetical protein
MPTKKKFKEDFVDETVEEVAPPPPAPPQDVVHEHVCVMCRYLAQGDLGPTCSNPQSPFHGQRMREEDGCDSFTPKP